MHERVVRSPQRYGLFNSEADFVKGERTMCVCVCVCAGRTTVSCFENNRNPNAVLLLLRHGRVNRYSFFNSRFYNIPFAQNECYTRNRRRERLDVKKRSRNVSPVDSPAAVYGQGDRTREDDDGRRRFRNHFHRGAARLFICSRCPGLT